MQYQVTGVLRAGRGTHPFERGIEAETKKHARDLVYAQLSSEHGIPRSRITIESVEET